MPVLVSGGGQLVTTHNTGLARPSVPLASYGRRGVELVDKVVSYGDLYYDQWAVATAVHKIERQVSRLPLKAYRRNRDGQRERLRTGSLGGVLKSPWHGAGPTHLKQAIMLPALVHGNALLRKVRAERGGGVTGFQPLTWELTNLPGYSGGQVEIWETNEPGSPRFLDPDDVVHIAFRGLKGQIGVSPLRQLGVTLSIEDAAQRYQQSIMRNGARPPSALEQSEDFTGLTPTEKFQAMTFLREDVNRLYAGPDRGGVPAILPPGLKWNKVGHTAVEAELIDQRKIAREEVFSCYDVSPPLVGLLERSTFNNITELHRMLYVTVLGPWLTLIEESFEAQLIAVEPSLRGDIFIEFDLSEVLKGDLLQRSQALALQIGYGVLTIDEARQIENRPTFDLPETSLPLYPANNLVPAGRAPDDVDASDSSVQDAAKALASLDEHDVRALLVRCGGSVIDAIYAIAEGDERATRAIPALT